MAYEPRLIAPFEDGGLVEYYKPWLIGNTAFPVLEDCYLWRGCVRKREGFELLGTVPTTPVNGFGNRIIPTTGDLQLVAFSKTKAYLFNTTGSTFDDISFYQTTGAAISWTGTDDDYFWCTNFAGSLWTTNNVDPIRFWNGSTTQGWNDQTPPLDSTTPTPTTYLLGALIVIPYKGVLVALNTQEGGFGSPTNYAQRARWCQRGTPYVTINGSNPPSANTVVPPTPFQTQDNAWVSDVLGKGGFIDADTTEKIVGAAIIKDILLVFFQRSTWRLTYTGNQVLPFIWERLNTQYGAESTFSTIPFDDACLAFSRFGYIASDTNSVRRIDEKIPDQTFFQTEFGSTLKNLQRIHGIRDFYRQTAYWAYPAANTNSATNNRVLAYNYLDGSFARFNQSFRCFGYYQTFDDRRWQDMPVPWENENTAWNGAGTQNSFPNIVAANVSTGDVYTVYDLDDVAQDDDTNFGFNITTKQFNPYLQEGHRCRLQYVDIYCSRTNDGKITVDLYTDDNQDVPIITRTVNLDTVNNAKYVRVFFGAIGRIHQLVLRLSDSQIDDPQEGTAQFELQGLVIWTKKEGRIKQ